MKSSSNKKTPKLTQMFSIRKESSISTDNNFGGSHPCNPKPAIMPPAEVVQVVSHTYEKREPSRVIE